MTGCQAEDCQEAADSLRAAIPAQVPMGEDLAQVAATAQVAVHIQVAALDPVAVDLVQVEDPGHTGSGLQRELHAAPGRAQAAAADSEVHQGPVEADTDSFPVVEGTDQVAEGTGPVEGTDQGVGTQVAEDNPVAELGIQAVTTELEERT